MKPVHYFPVLLSVIVSINLQAQQDQPTGKPKTEYKVNRQYDDKGNIIAYDSTSITTWQSDPGFRTFEYFEEFDDNDSISDKGYFDPWNSFGFDFPHSDPFYWPFSPYNSEPFDDSIHSPIQKPHPFFDFGFTDPFGSSDHSRQFREMHERMNKMMEEQMLFFKQWEEENNRIREQIPHDSIRIPVDPIMNPVKTKPNSIQI